MHLPHRSGAALQRGSNSPRATREESRDSTRSVSKSPSSFSPVPLEHHKGSTHAPAPPSLTNPCQAASTQPSGSRRVDAGPGVLPADVILIAGGLGPLGGRTRPLGPKRPQVQNRLPAMRCSRARLENKTCVGFPEPATKVSTHLAPPSLGSEGF